ncbi:MAG: DNA-directed RNA polymerase subunit beta', partial [Candidatus Poribacteria bacterium]
LEAYGAAHNLYEMMTVKSNATAGIPFYRRLAHGDIPVLEGMDGDTPTFKLLTNCLRGLGIDLTKDDEGVHICLASPEQIREWSQGEVGLNIPQLSHRIQQGDQIEEEIRESSLIELPNSHAMGQIELALPVSHVWFFKGLDSQIAPLLNLTFEQLESVLYFENYIVLDSATDSLKVGQVVTKEEYETFNAQHDFRAGIGGAAVRELLERIDLKSEEEKLVSTMQVTTQEEGKRKLEKRLKLVRNFLQSGVRPEWMLLKVLPVVPQAMRPTVPVSDEGQFATSDLNLLYRSVILRNKRLNRLIDLDAPQTIIHNEARMLQQAVDALIYNGRYGRIARNGGDRPLRSLSDILKGKEGMFRRRLLGARMDYSGRSVIVPGPELRMDECGLPRDIALKLFEPFVIHELMISQQAASIRGAKRIVDEKRPEAIAMLDKVTEGKVVLLNRAPTLHRGNLQAFKPVLIDEKAIRLQPLMCAAFNADFDGDQMAVHLPLTKAAQKESRELMLSHRNLMLPAAGSLLARPELESVLGCYYLTLSSNADVR